MASGSNVLSTTSPFTVVKIDTAASGDLTLFAAASGLITRLYRILLVSAGSTTLTFKDGSTTLTGAMTLNAGGSIVLDYTAVPWFATSVNSALVLNNSAAVQISGVAYMIRSV